MVKDILGDEIASLPVLFRHLPEWFFLVLAYVDAELYCFYEGDT